MCRKLKVASATSAGAGRAQGIGIVWGLQDSLGTREGKLVTARQRRDPGSKTSERCVRGLCPWSREKAQPCAWVGGGGGDRILKSDFLDRRPYCRVLSVRVRRSLKGEVLGMAWVGVGTPGLCGPEAPCRAAASPPERPGPRDRERSLVASVEGCASGASPEASHMFS